MTSLFNKDHSVCFTQARKGEVIVTQGYGQSPKVWRPCVSPPATDPVTPACHAPWKDSGTPAPTVAPTVEKSDNATYYVARLDIIDAGEGLKLPPVVTIDNAPAGGVTAEAVTRIAEERMSETEVTEFGKGYTEPPAVTLSLNDDAAEGTVGELQAIMRASFRGKYQCYYRFANKSVPEDEGGPLYSNLSPVTVVDTKDGSSQLTWTLPNNLEVPDNCTIELWRSSANQATTLYFIKELTTEREYVDVINEHDLTDADREDFSALPILLPNGELNANRFGVMSSDFAVAVMFQDRLWYGVDTTNNRPNSLMFSETDEPESCPDINEIIIQQNLRSADYVTALIPYAGALIACQSRHCHRLTYVSQPLIDVSTFLVAYRGCCSQRTWDIYEGVAYIMDDQGVYSLDPQGKLEPLTVGIDNLFQDQIDWSKREWFIVRADRKLNILRCLVCFKGDEGKYPTRQLCYSLDYKAWWVEVYSQRLIGSTDCRASKSGKVERLWGGITGNTYRIGTGLTDQADGAIVSVDITNKGRGYKQPPTITATGGSCAQFAASINTDGQVTGIQIRHCGTGYASGYLVISAPELGGTQATARYTTQGGTTPVYYSFQSGNMEFTTDTQDPKANTVENRQVSVVYKPTDSSSVLNLETYYNGASYPRSNVCSRDRGTGFVHSEDVPAATLDMQKTQIQDSEAHGVARALFAGRTLDDMSGNDRHLSIGLSGKQDSSGRVTLHVVDIYGVNGGS